MLKRLLFLIAFLPILASAQTDPTPSVPVAKPVTSYQQGDSTYIYQNGKWFHVINQAAGDARYPRYTTIPSTLMGGIFKNTAGGLFVPGSFYYDNTNSQYVFTQPILANALGYGTVAYRIGATSTGLFVRDTVSYALKYGTTATLPAYIKNYVDSLRALQPDLSGSNTFTNANTFSGGSPLTLANAGLAINGNGSDGSQSINFGSNALYYNSGGTSLSWNGHGIGIRTNADWGFTAANTTAGYTTVYNPGYIQYTDPSGGYTQVGFLSPPPSTARFINFPDSSGTVALKGDTSGLNIGNTYLAKTDTSAMLSNVLHKYRSETVYGPKTFNQALTLKNQSSIPATPASGYTNIFTDNLGRLNIQKSDGYLRTLRFLYPGSVDAKFPYKSSSVLADSTDVSTNYLPSQKDASTNYRFIAAKLTGGLTNVGSAPTLTDYVITDSYGNTGNSESLRNFANRIAQGLNHNVNINFVSGTTVQQASVGDNSFEYRVVTLGAVPAYNSATTGYAIILGGINDIENASTTTFTAANYQVSCQNIVNSLLAEGYPINHIIFTSPQYPGQATYRTRGAAYYSAWQTVVSANPGIIAPDIYNAFANSTVPVLRGDSIHAQDYGNLVLAQTILSALPASGVVVPYNVSNGQLIANNGIIGNKNPNNNEVLSFTDNVTPGSSRNNYNILNVNKVSGGATTVTIGQMGTNPQITGVTDILSLGGSNSSSNTADSTKEKLQLYTAYNSDGSVNYAKSIGISVHPSVIYWYGDQLNKRLELRRLYLQVDSGAKFTGLTSFPIAGTRGAFNLGVGSNASAPVNGDIWGSSGGYLAYYNGTTRYQLGTTTVLGTISTGVWNGTVVGAQYGGTGLASYTIGDIPYASGSTTLSKLADVAIGSVLVSGGVGVAPSYSTALPNGITATTQTTGDATGKAATDAFVQNQIAATVTQKFLRLTGSGTGSATTISIAHGQSGVTSASIAVVQPINAASQGIQYITTDATNINIVYSVAPASGTNNLSYNVILKP